MIGYKAITLQTGVLKSKYGYIFEVGIPTDIVRVSDSNDFSENGYSFCGTIEQVISHENYLKSEESRILDDIRLFEIEAVGKTIGVSYHYKAEQIIVKREIPKDEIISHLESNKDALERVYKEITPEEYALYKASAIEDYRVLTEKDEIEKVYVKSCGRLWQNGMCLQDSSQKLDSSRCEGCWGKDLHMSIKTFEANYLYLLARAKLLEGQPCESIPEYRKLLQLSQQDKTINLACESLIRIENYKSQRC